MIFSHRDLSTPEDEWVGAGVLDLSRIPQPTLADRGTVLVLSAHPDDEAFGCASLLAHTRLTGCPVRVLLFTAGEKSHPHSTTHTQNDLRGIRLREFSTALRELNDAATSRFLGFPDGGLQERRIDVLHEIRAEVSRIRGPLTIVAPYSGDGHSDHEALGVAALTVGRDTRTRVLEYPIWYWHWARPSDPRWRQWRFLPDPADLDRQQLWTCYRSQTQALSDAPGDEAILGRGQLDHLSRGGDTFAVTDHGPVPDFGPSAYADSGVDTAAADETNADEPRINSARTARSVFDELHSGGRDPWELRDSDYEIAKRTTVLTQLPDNPYDHILEIGCSIGVLSERLAQLSGRVTAVDASGEALTTAARLHPETPNLSFVRATVPYDWPRGRFDCVVLSETGFYLSAAQLRRTLRRIDECTTPTFVLVLCHWKGTIHDWPLDADTVHEICLGHWPRRRIEFHTESDYRLDIVTVTKEPITALTNDPESDDTDNADD